MKKFLSIVLLITSIAAHGMAPRLPAFYTKITDGTKITYMKIIEFGGRYQVKCHVTYDSLTNKYSAYHYEQGVCVPDTRPPCTEAKEIYEKLAAKKIAQQ